jgi:two-component system, cell cycle sensor histidine kinase and response regulator CckA
MEDTHLTKSNSDKKDRKPRLRAIKSKRQPNIGINYPFLFTAVLVAIILTVVTVWGIRTAVYSDRLGNFETNAAKMAAAMESSVLQNRYSAVPETLGIASSDLKQAILGERPPNNPDLVNLLSAIKAVNEASLVYIMNAEGTVVGSTIYDDGKTLVGENYGFRPYFKEALKGRNYLYSALGVTTKKRGLYYSAPVYGAFEQPNQPDDIIGVITLKLGLSEVDAWLNGLKDPAALVTSKGVIFACNRKEWMFHTTRVDTTVDAMQFSDVERADLKYLNADLNGPWVNLDGRTYALARKTLGLKDEFGKWELIWLQDTAPWFPVWNMAVCSAIAALFYFLLVLFFFHQMVRKQAEAVLRESEEKFRLLSDQSLMGIHIICNGVFVYVNKASSEIIGYPIEEMTNWKPNEFAKVIHPDDLAFVMEQAKKKQTGGKDIVVNYEWRLISKSGTIKWIESFSKTVPFGKELADFVMMIDITDRKRSAEEKMKLEARLQRAEKMEMIGTLAGGVAHDLNNILSGLVSYPELLLLDIPEESPLRNPILTIRSSGQKAAAIVQDLLTLARRGLAVTEVVNLNDVIKDYLRSAEFEKLKGYHAGVQFKVNLGMNMLNIFGSPVHLSKTIMNLISNAAEALPDGGEIALTTKNLYVDKPIAGYDEVKEGDYVVFNITDNGIGISSEDMKRVFEPFYTKKVMGRSGTGLGMAVVWGTAKDHNGYIDIQSKEGEGTSFTLYFPVTRKKRAKDESLLAIKEYMGKGESVLVVDDVEEQREIATGILNKLGYSVTSIPSGEEAVAYMKNNSADLIVLDMIMDPGIDGLETYEKILKHHPNQKAIIASGYSETEDVRVAQKLGVGQYIKKPYTLEKIGVAVRDELKK